MMKKYLLLITLNFCTILLMAMPAKKEPIVFVQPNGSTITINLHGDEHFSYRTSTDGYLLVESTDGYMNYAKMDEAGNITNLNVRAHNTTERSDAEVLFTTKLQTTQELQEVQKASILRKSTSQTPLKVFPQSGSPRSLVILVNFSDNTFVTASPKDAFTNLLNKDGYSVNGGTGSAKDYFRDNSNGNFVPQFDVVGPYTLPNNMAYYGTNLYSSANSDANARQMVIDACNLAHADGIDFSQYDTDNNGYVDNVFVYYAGYNEAEGAPSTTIWPHRWTVGNTSTVLDGKIVYDYACTSELRGYTGGSMCGIGTFCHEFGHVLGLPDMYATNNATHHTLSSWDIMDYGGYSNNGRTPPAYSSYERFFLGWLTPVEIQDKGNFTLNPLNTSNTAYLVSQYGNHNLDGKNPNSTEFFMLENRQKTGWDKYLPGHGLLITRIYYSQPVWKANTVNNVASAMGIDIMEADSIATDNTLGGDPFPGTYSVTKYNPISRSGSDFHKPLTEITETSGVISFKFMGGAFYTNVAPVAIAATNVTSSSFTANWNKADQGSAYLLDVYKVNGLDTTYVTGFNAKNVGNVLTYNITGLDASTTYYYRLRTTNDDDEISINSNVIEVATTQSSSISNIDENIKVVSKNGVIEIYSNNSQLNSVDIINAQGAKLYSNKFTNYLSISANNLPKGVYIFKINNQITKIVL